jgi:hypothetical protein
VKWMGVRHRHTLSAPKPLGRRDGGSRELLVALVLVVVVQSGG